MSAIYDDENEYEVPATIHEGNGSYVERKSGYSRKSRYV